MQINNKLIAIICLIFMVAISLLQPNGAEAHSGSIGYSEVTSRQVLLFSFDQASARLIGERIYEDPAATKYEEVDEADVIPIAEFRDIHRSVLNEIEVGKPAKYWTLDVIKKQLENRM